MQEQISGIGSLVNTVNSKLSDIQTSINNIENLTDKTTENSVLYNTIDGHSKQIEKFDKFFD
jgi:prefoldin subunit 5